MSIEIDREAIKSRQAALVDEMQRRGIGFVALMRHESVQWLTGAYVGPLWKSIAAINDQGEVTLILPSRKVEIPAVADHIFPYVEKRLSTMCDASEQVGNAINALFDNLNIDFPNRSGCEVSVAPQSLVISMPGECVDVDSIMFRLRRKKYNDELAVMKRANDANRRMYEIAREIIEPGLNELDLYNTLQSVAVKELGEPLTYFGQDFRANARGGMPRDRQAEAGELWILDLGVGYGGYYTDNARTIAVSDADDNQQRAWKLIAEVFDMIREMVTPGVSCKGVFETAQHMLAEAEPWAFNHHLGHGVGLAPHEAPRLNPNWDDTFAVGDFFTVEPGLYHDDLRHGIRLEQNYVVTESGVELLSDWPLEL